MYALGGIARGGATRGGYVPGSVFVSIGGVQYAFGRSGTAGTIIESLSIQDELDETPNTCRFRVNGAVPPIGAEVVVTLGSKNRLERLFGGFVLALNQIYAADKPANVQAEVSAVDYSWLFGFQKVTKRYTNLSATAIARDLVTSYAAANGFTSAAVASGLPVLDEITFTNEELDQAMTRLARRIGGYWYVDYLKDVHLFLEEVRNGDPTPLTPTHPSLAHVTAQSDRTQALTRVYVEGRGSRLLSNVAAGETLLPVDAVDMFAVAADVFLKVSRQGAEGSAWHLNFAGVVTGGAGSLVGPGIGPPGALLATPTIGAGLSLGHYQYAYTDVTASGETLPSPLAHADIGMFIGAGLQPLAVPAVYSPGIEAGYHEWAYTYVTAGGGETTLSQPIGALTQGPLTPTGGIFSVTLSATGPLTRDYTYVYVVTYVGELGGETTRADMSWQVDATLSAATQRADLLIGSDTPGTWSVPAGTTAIKVYRSKSTGFGQPQGPLKFAGNATVTTVGGQIKGTFTDLTTDAALGAAPPTTNTALARYGKVTVTTIFSPSLLVTGVKIYRTPVGVSGSGFKLVASVTVAQGGTQYVDTTPDASLGAAPPTTNTAGTEYRAMALSQIAIGPPATTDRKIYRTVANGSQLRFLGAFGNNTGTSTTDVVADASLGANAPVTDTSGLQQPPGQVPAGSIAFIVANTTVFQATGGWAVIGNGEQVIRYTGISGNTLTGIPPAGIGAVVAGVAYNSTVTAAPMLTGIPATGTRSVQVQLTAGDEIYLVVQCDDTARQSALAAAVGGNGIREEWVQDRRLSITEARARGTATLALRPLTQTQVSYTCRDLRTAAGKSIVVNLPPPTNLAGTFKIQQVTIDNFRPYPTQYPTFTVTASTARFSFEDWLRRLQTKD